jgi:bla regulator protein BlaR1
MRLQIVLYSNSFKNNGDSRELRMNRNRTALCLAFAIALNAPLGISQSPQPPVPEWQTAAGGKMSFDVASIRPTKPDEFTPPNFPLSSDDSYAPNGGLLTADFPVMVYIEFAYKIWLAPAQRKAILATLPKWVDDENLEIHARVDGNPTKDQMRLMMQSLLADRFNLRLHFENQQTSVLALTLIKPGKFGPSLRLHSEGPPCDPNVSITALPPPDSAAAKIFPEICYSYMAKAGANHTILLGSRNTTMQSLANSLTSLGNNIDRPVLDQTGITENVDFTLEWAQEFGKPSSPAAESLSDPQGPTFFQALKEQLGLKLEPTKAPMDILVVDHIELPSEN